MTAVSASTQLNVKVPAFVAVGAKRLARQRGVPLNEYIATLIANDLASEHEALEEQLREDERALQWEREMLMTEVRKNFVSAEQ